MGSFGERLQREREMRGITLEEIAEATKIGTRSLRALEEEQFDKLPGGIFNKGFVRAYSRYLGIDEEQAVADYMAALGEGQSNLQVMPTDQEIVSAVVEKKLGNIDDDELRVPPMAWGALAVLLIVVVGAVAGWRYVSQHGWPQLRRAQAASVRPSAPPVAAPAPSTTTTAAAEIPTTAKTSTAPPQPVSARTDARAAAPSADGFLLRVRAKKDTWVLLIVDGKQEMSGMLPADAERAVRAQRRVVFKTGNAAAVELFQDGKPLPLLGEEKQVKQVTITAKGMEESKKSEVESKKEEIKN